MIFLQRITTEDASARYLSWINDPKTTEFLEIRFKKYNLADLKLFLENTIKTQQNGDLEPLFTIRLQATGEHIGNIKLGPINTHHSTADIGLLIGQREWWGKGIATEAIRLICDYAFKERNLQKLKAGCYASNMNSARAFERNGFKIEGQLRSQVSTVSGERTNLILLGLCREEWGEKK